MKATAKEDAGVRWLECGWCGQWHSETACSACSTLVPSASEGRPTGLGVVVELLAHGTGVLDLERIIVPQAPWLSSGAGRAAVESALGPISGAVRPGAALSVEALSESRSAVRQGLREVWLARLGLRSADPESGAFIPPFDVRFLVRSLMEGLKPPARRHAWIRFSDFRATAEQAGRALNQAEIKLGVQGANPGETTWTLHLSCGCFALIETLKLEPVGAKSWVAVKNLLLEPKKKRLVTVELSAAQQLALSNARRFKIAVKCAGSPKEFHYKDIEVRGPELIEADLFLDLGSTATKFLFVPLNGSAKSSPQERTTGRFLRKLGLPAYDKKAHALDPAGVAVWAAAAGPAIREWARKDNLIVRDLHLALPEVGTSSAWSKLKAALPRTKGALKEAPNSGQSTDRTGVLRVHKEHAALAFLFAAALTELREAVETQANRIEVREGQISRSRQEQANWARKKTKRDQERREVEKRRKKATATWWFPKKRGLVVPDPYSKARPADPPPEEQELRDWMLTLSRDPTRIDRLVLLDAGGMSLDVAVLEGGRQVQGRGGSHSCGGEDVSARIGDHERGNAGTGRKVKLARRLSLKLQGDAWKSVGVLHEYHRATVDVYGTTLREKVLSPLKRLWGTQKPCIVVITGGGAANPFLRMLIQQVAVESGLDAQCFESSDLANYVAQVQAYGLEGGPAVARLLKVHKWNTEVGDTSEGGHYDRFAMVGGMWTEWVGESSDG